MNNFKIPKYCAYCKVNILLFFFSHCELGSFPISATRRNFYPYKACTCTKWTKEGRRGNRTWFRKDRNMYRILKRVYTLKRFTFHFVFVSSFLFSKIYLFFIIFCKIEFLYDILLLNFLYQPFIIIYYQCIVQTLLSSMPISYI